MSPAEPSTDDLAAIAVALDDFVEYQRNRWTPLDASLVGFIDAAADFVSQGKRMRPLFCLAGWRAATGAGQNVPAPPGIVTAAASWEWLQGSALVHDDLIDASDTRRGKPSVHRAFAQLHRAEQRVGDPTAYGSSTAILLGDLMLSWCDEMLRHAGSVDPDLRSVLPDAFAVLDLCKNEVALGQYLDVVSQTRADADAETARLVVTFKSAKYTIERPLHLGARLGGGDDDLLARLSLVAVPLGSAFQLRDDLLGVFGDPATTGKPAGDDLREGKRTLLVARAFERLSEADAVRLTETLGTSDGVPIARDLIAASGAVEDVEAEITRQADEAREALANLPVVTHSTLEPLIERAVRRNR